MDFNLVAATAIGNDHVATVTHTNTGNAWLNSVMAIIAISVFIDTAADNFSSPSRVVTVSKGASAAA